MHICIFTPDYPSKGRPVYTFVDNLCRAFCEAGNEVTVIAPQNLLRWLCGQRRIPFVRRHKIGSCNLTIYSPFNITAHSLPLIGSVINKISEVYLSFFFKTLHINPDIIYCHFWRSGLGIYKEAKRRGIPIFVATGESTIRLKNNSKKIKEYCESVSGVICVSTKNKNESINNGLVTEDNCIVIPNAVDSKIFYTKDKKKLRKKFGFSENDFIVSYVGYFNKRKGSKRLSDAISMLHDTNIKVLFIGASKDKDCEPDCPGIIYKGKLEQSLIADYLNSADVFVLPTLQEGCCNAIIEAMACGLPIISSNKDFNKDLLDSSCALLVDPLDVNEIAKAIKQLKDAPSLLHKLSKSAYKKAEELTLEARVNKIIRFIESK